MTDAWVSLFSGGKDSTAALHRALESGRSVERLLTVHPGEDSYMYHVPATELASLAAESIGIPLVELDPADFAAGGATDATAQGDRELEPLERGIDTLAEDLDGHLAGLTAGAVESEFQTSRLQALCDRQGIELYAPLWERDPETLAEELLEAGFEIRIVQVAAAGLDESWLGRRFDAETIDALARHNEEHGVHLLGEGGEFETLVVDGPHMDRRIGYDADREWEGNWGRLRITDAWLE
jgi:ABC transporter with metal-binding/Fe-S-binding domain ATP-binding protein